MSPKKPPLTEGQLTKRLEAKYSETAGNGDAWAFVPQVRNAAGFDAKRTIDAYAMSLWPSRGLELIALEIKSSRSDWLRELKEGAKAEAFGVLADRFYIVVGDPSIVHEGELPPTWGLMVPHGNGLKVAVEAPPLRDMSERPRPLPPEFDRSFLAALLRRATAQGEATPKQITEAVESAVLDERERSGVKLARAEERAEGLAAKIRTFEQAAGVSLENPYTYQGDYTAAELGAVVKAVMQGDKRAEVHIKRLRRLRDSTCELSETIDRELAKLDGVAA